jgi:hypothetical protein
VDAAPPTLPEWSRLLRWVRRWRAALFVLIALVYLAGMNGQWRITADGAIHVEAAYLLTEGGLAVLEPGLLERSQPGLGWLLALAGGPGWVAQGLMLGLAAAALWLNYRLINLHADGPTAAICTLLLAGCGLFHEMALGLLTELPFTVGLLLLLWGHERRVQRLPGVGWSLTLIAAGWLVMAMFRSVAAVVAAVYVLAEVLRGLRGDGPRWLGEAVVGGFAVIGLGLWLASAAVRDDVAIFFAALWPPDLDRYAFNASQVWNEALPEAVTGQDVPPPGSWVVSLGVVAVMVSLAKVRPLWALLGGAFVLQWVVFAADTRYVLPLLPLLIYGGWRLLVASSAWLGGYPGKAWFRIVLIGLAAANLTAVAFTTIEQRRADFYDHYQGGKYVAVREAADWLQGHTPAGTSVATARPVWAELAVLSRRVVRPAVDPGGVAGGHAARTPRL